LFKEDIKLHEKRRHEWISVTSQEAVISCPLCVVRNMGFVKQAPFEFIKDSTLS